jgi:outer membrane murein-binding lipoprotein Lpp
VTLRAMTSAARGPVTTYGLAAVLAGLVVAGACGRPGDELAEAQRAARAASEQATALEDRVGALSIDVSEARSAIDAAAEEQARLSARLTKALKRLNGALGRLESAVAEAKAASDDASSNATSAVAEIEGVAHDLVILQNRYDYHLRHYHGGAP